MTELPDGVVIVENAQGSHGVEYRGYAAWPAYCFGSDGTAWTRTNNRHGLSSKWRIRRCPLVNGYPMAPLKVGGERCVAVHRAICELWHGSAPSAGHEVRHLDGTRTNSKPDNLAWGTRLENQHDRYAHGTDQFGTRNHMAKLTPETIIEIREKYASGSVDQVSLAMTYGVSRSAIGNIVNGKAWPRVGGPRTNGSARRFRFTTENASVLRGIDPEEFIKRCGLTRDALQEIRRLYAERKSISALSVQFQCSTRTIKNVISGRLANV